ncbi:hypothetical protein H3S75_05160 [Gilliamella sp. B14384G15]|uniref:hypothetical protein n=1 Tax=unclassified Gilliamella TaxID=2685620 RepID=UPI0018DDB007|nr:MULTISPECIES: hypothetical protein [unclassified Gilliamella]MBI0030615.1 hypothetical protein [Gilliamella sp. B14384G15]MBI0057911.1 hypothetical protein [Gilliamella sp. B14384G12]
MNKEKNGLIIKNTPDYYIAREQVNGEIISKPIRKKIREIVYEVREYIKDNETQQASIVKLNDANDIIFEFFKNESDDVFAEIINTYTEEFTAVTNDETNKIIHKTEKILEQEVEHQQSALYITSIAAMIFFSIVLFLIIK